jgi:hypothetical protein
MQTMNLGWRSLPTLRTAGCDCHDEALARVKAGLGNTKWDGEITLTAKRFSTGFGVLPGPGAEGMVSRLPFFSIREAN